MGGRKKLTLKQMERMQRRREQREEKPRVTAAEKKKKPGVIPPDPRSEKVIDEIRKMRVLTPYAVASRFNLRLSIAKDFLEELEHRGIVEYVSGSRNIKIYKLCN